MPNETKTFKATLKPQVRSLLVSSANASPVSENYLKVLTLLAGQQVEISCENLHNMRFKVTPYALNKGYQILRDQDSPWAVTLEKLEELKAHYCDPDKPLSVAVKAFYLTESMDYISDQVKA